MRMQSNNLNIPSENVSPVKNCVCVCVCACVCVSLCVCNSYVYVPCINVNGNICHGCGEI